MLEAIWEARSRPQPQSLPQQQCRHNDDDDASWEDFRGRAEPIRHPPSAPGERDAALDRNWAEARSGLAQQWLEQQGEQDECAVCKNRALIYCNAGCGSLCKVRGGGKSYSFDF